MRVCVVGCVVVRVKVLLGVFVKSSMLNVLKAVVQVLLVGAGAAIGAMDVDGFRRLDVWAKGP